MSSDYLVSRALLISTLLLAFAANAVSAQNPDTELLKKSTIVFVGTVTRKGVASFKAVPASARTMLVRVDSILEKPPAVSLSAQDTVTVEVKDPSPFRKGVRATFYTEGWIFGEGIALREVGHKIMPKVAASSEMDKSREEHAQVRQAMSDAELRGKIEAADVVVVGWVTEVRPSAMASMESSRTKRISEHDPDWRDAIVRVESTIKGASVGQEVVLRFPASLDVSWYNVPKLKQGQTGTFILKKDQLSNAPRATLHGEEVNTFMVLDQRDVLSKQEAERVRALSQPERR